MEELTENPFDFFKRLTAKDKSNRLETIPGLIEVYNEEAAKRHDVYIGPHENPPGLWLYNIREKIAEKAQQMGKNPQDTNSALGKLNPDGRTVELVWAQSRLIKYLKVGLSEKVAKYENIINFINNGVPIQPE